VPLDIAGKGKAEDKTWNVAPFDPVDLPAIEDFFKKNYHGPGPYGTIDLFRWKIIDNYVRSGVINLIKDKDQIVSVLSITPKLLYFKGREHAVVELGDALTDPRYRRQGMFAFLDNKITKDALDMGFRFVYGTPNKEALPGHLKKANYKIIDGINVKSLVVPLDIKPFIQKRGYWLIGNLAGSLFSTLVYGCYLVKKALSWSQAAQIEEPENIPEGWNDFWMKSREACDFIFSRDREALTWRFFKNPNRYTFYVLKEKDQIVGYLAYRIVSVAEITAVVLADFFFLPGYEKGLKVLLFRVLEDALNANVATINTWCTQGSPYFRVLKKFGFIERGDVPVICFQNDFASNLETSCRTWHFTVSDSDNI
jgi:hypothetical protein